MFDSCQSLGMICPIIVDNAQHGRDEWTVFRLSLSLDEEGLQMLKDHLLGLRGSVLLFLRRLRLLEVLVDASTASYTLAKNPDFSTVYSHPHRHDTTKYIHVCCPWEMPPHKYRGANTVTALAFPFSENGPIIKCQDIFAFLPLKPTLFSVLPISIWSNELVPRPRRFSYANQSRGHFG